METMSGIMQELAAKFGINPRQLKEVKKRQKDLGVWERAKKRLEEEGSGSVARYKELLNEEEALKKDEAMPRKPQSYDEFIEQLKKPSSKENDNCPYCGKDNNLTPGAGMARGQEVCPWCKCAWETSNREILVPPPGKEEEK